MVVLGRYQPVLDPTIGVINELVEKGEAELVVPSVGELESRRHVANGLAVDILELTYHLFPYFDTEIIITGVKKSHIIRGREEGGLDKLSLKVRFTRGDFGETADGKYVSQTSIDRSEGKRTLDSRVIVHAKKSNRQSRSFFLGYLSEYGISPPLPQHRISVSFSDGHSLPFFINTVYQNFEPLSSQYDSYPVSSKNTHLLPTRAWRIIQSPVFWWSQGNIYQHALMILSGEKTVEDDRNLEYIKGRVEQAIPTIYKFMEALLEKGKVSQVLRDSGAQNGYYAELALRYPLKALNHLVNPETLGNSRRQFLDNLVERYNNEYASKNGKITTSAEELVDAVAFSKNHITY